MSQILIGLDKIELGGFEVASIDFARLIQMAQAGDKDNKIRVSPPNKEGAWYVKIPDNYMFGDLVAGTSKDGYRYWSYVYISITPTHVCGDNMHNLRKTDYDEHLEHLLSYLTAKYGISLRAKDIFVRYMEINCNIPLKETYRKYTRVIKLLMSFCGKHLRQEVTYRNLGQPDAGATTYMRYNGSWAIVVYNKSLQMAQKYPDRCSNRQDVDAQRDLMRIEIRLHTARKIKNIFRSNRWSQITDQAVCTYYHRVITKPWTTQYKMWIRQKDKELEELLQFFKSEKGRDWYHEIMHYAYDRAENDGIPYILDNQQLQEAYRGLPDTHRTSCRVCDKLWDVGDPRDLYHRNDRDKVAEILSKISASQSDAEIKE